MGTPSTYGRSVNVTLACSVLESTTRETVPIHFNGKGEGDGFGPKWQIFILPVLAIITGLFMYFVSLFPYTFNYTQEVTQENASELYQRSTRMLRIVNALTMVFMAFLTFIILRSALNQKWSNGVAFGLAIGAYTLSVMYIAFTAMKKK